MLAQVLLGMHPSGLLCGRRGEIEYMPVFADMLSAVEILAGGMEVALGVAASVALFDEAIWDERHVPGAYFQDLSQTQVLDCFRGLPLKEIRTEVPCVRSTYIDIRLHCMQYLADRLYNDLAIFSQWTENKQTLTQKYRTISSSSPMYPILMLGACMNNGLTPKSNHFQSEESTKNSLFLMITWSYYHCFGYCII